MCAWCDVAFVFVYEVCVFVPVKFDSVETDMDVVVP